MKKAVGIVAVGVLAAAALVWTPGLGAQSPPPPPPVPFGPDFLMLQGPGSSIGVGVRELTEQEAATSKAQGGAVIDRVQVGSPAERAGLREGDVVTEFDGERVRSIRQFSRLVRDTPPGRSVRVIVLRNGQQQTLNVQPESGRDRVRRFDRDFDFNFDFDFARDFDFDLDRWLPSEGGFSVAWGNRLGATLTPLSDQLAQYFGVKDGVLVSSVEMDSASSRAGLRAGDVITEAGGRMVSRPSDVTESIRRTDPGSALSLKIVRDKKEMTLSATVPERNRPRTRAGRPI
jgi:serine protease Do